MLSKNDESYQEYLKYELKLKEDQNEAREKSKMKEKEKKSKQMVKKKVPKPENNNFLFYSGNLNSKPNNLSIDDIHLYWWYDYNLLEQEHGYIQWLFPVFESGGMNFLTVPLNKEESKMIRHDLKCAIRVVRSYKMMLNFYGITLTNESTGEVEKNNIWETRFYNLDCHFHNNLRINRILLSLGHLGFTRYKEPLLRFFEKVIVKEGHLHYSHKSLVYYWQKTIEYDSKEYITKTRELPEDREDSIFFQMLSQNDESYQEYLKSELKLQEDQNEASEKSKMKEKEKLNQIRKLQAKNKQQKPKNNNQKRGAQPEQISTKIFTFKK
jgi:hypothetical protein